MNYTVATFGKLIYCKNYTVLYIFLTTIVVTFWSNSQTNHSVPCQSEHIGHFRKKYITISVSTKIAELLRLVPIMRPLFKAGKPTYKYSWIMDKLAAERERGISIDTKLRRIETRNFYVNIIDAPGHPDYCHNMLTGASQVINSTFIVGV